MSKFPVKQDLAEVVFDLKRRVEQLESANPLASASAGVGGITIRDSGALTVLDNSGDVVAVFDGSGYVKTAATTTDVGSSINTSTYNDELTLTFTPPAAWNTYQLVAQGQLRISPGNINNDVQTRLSIGASNGPEVDNGTNGTIDFYSFVAHADDDLSGAVTVAIQSKRTDSLGNPNPNILYQALSYTAIRKS